MNYNLRDKVAIITGGASGIGKATTELFCHSGGKVAVWDVNESRGKDLVQALSDQGQSVVFMKVDTSSDTQIRQAVQDTLVHFGRIDILVNNAGITMDSTLLKMTDEQWDKVIDINLKGVFYCTRAVAPHMIQQGSGRIINASSVVALYGNFGQTNYVATKAGVIGMTKTWARELGRKGINVNAVAPGFILTEMVQAMPEQVLAKMAEKVPLNQLGSPEDIAHIYAFLSSDGARYINGATISVDGGMTI